MEDSVSQSPSKRQEEEGGGEESVKQQEGADEEGPESPLGPIEQNPQHSGMSASASSSTPFPPPPVSICYPPPNTTAQVSNQLYPPLTSPSVAAAAAQLEGLLYSKRKKGKPNLKKQKSIIRKCETLMAELSPIPFAPLKNLDFAKHEGLLRRLGLWDFVHTEFDSSLRVDLIAQLVATYDSKARCSYVNGTRIGVNRADFARAFKLPVKKGEAVRGDGVSMDLKELTEEEEKSFLEEFMSNWVFLHEDDTWMMPREALNWSKMIKDGHMEKIDWAGVFWFMIEKELAQGEKLRDCYYAPHLQQLIKSQHQEMFSKGGETEKSECDVEAKEEECDGNKDDVKLGEMSMVQEKEVVPVKGPSIELTLGQDGGDNGEVRDAEMVDVEKGNADEENEEQGPSNVKDNIGDHFLEPCNMDQGEGLYNNNEVNIEEGDESEEEEGDKAEDRFDDVPNHDSFEGDGLTGNFLQAMETNQLEFTPQEQFGDESAMELLAARTDLQHANLASQSYYGNGGKRVLVQEENPLHESLTGCNKRLKIDSQWDGNLSDLGTCMEQIEQLVARARMMCEKKENSEEELKVNHQVLLNEMQKRDAMIEHLNRTTCEEIQKRDGEIFRLERELYVMGNLVEGYKRAFKGIQKVFVEYRQRFPLPEEPIYRDAGPGGIMLSATEIERLRLKREEEHRLNCLMLEQKAKEAGEEYVSQFEAYDEKVRMLGERLKSYENKVKQLKEWHGNRKAGKSEQQVTGSPECEQQVTGKQELDQQVTENPKGEQQVTENPERKQQVTENLEREQVTENPEREEQVTGIPEREEQVTGIPEREEQVTGIPDREEQVTENPDHEQQVTENPEREQQVTENPELPANA